MGKLFTGILLVLMFICWCGKSEGKCQKTNTETEMVNGYPATDFYYNNIKIPADVEQSEKKSDKINVAIHYKIVAFEKEGGKPLKALTKNEMEDKLQQFELEAIEELGFAPAPSPPAPATPTPKPAIIHGDDQDKN